ncbi:hypothetical protein PHYSODRAFT_472503 [Phytophthora sojae]|uniref:RING-type domain-containing protein n=1 Tax=Phytophthora sojae (strain P6497) TaxID=1094619 RepID=G4YQB1_PHYSP|nr:hypothetical protein PHYSODRAFT_472503 [Phytophthora sojae]EGZ29877.1 hypothetical protein PHYSODRAFT_472503 [Phytophthora sojae]|eukprot:XP_009517152.1 hypothetical protein PHYSODRAFT_472503 [Phytophthora sojae]
MANTACQICLDTIESGNELVTNVCGKSCSAQVCTQCMGRHVDVTLQQFYPGVLPRVRCPICLVEIHDSRWKTRVPSDLKTPLTTKYSELCRQACVVTPPCCHKTDYTHLPLYNPERRIEGSLTLLPSQLAHFQSLCKQFCRHKGEPRAVLNYAMDTFGEEKTLVLVNALTLPRIEDPERRATLLLSLMYLRPNTKTNCCGADFCFNCKRRGHHETCVEEFDEDNDLVRCRTCRALLLKVDGCDSVNCVCGFFMNWAQERSLRQQHKKRLLPVDIFDIPLTDEWLYFRERLAEVMKKLWLQKHIVLALRPLLHSRFSCYVWRFRFRKSLAIKLKDACEVRRLKILNQDIAAVKGVLRAAVAAHVWRRRFSKILRVAQPEMYWKAYHRWHAEELEDEAEEVNSFFRIGAFDDE